MRFALLFLCLVYLPCFGQNDWFLGTIYHPSLQDSAAVLYTNPKGVLTEKLLPIHTQYNVPYKSILLSNKNYSAAFFSSSHRYGNTAYRYTAGLKNLNNTAQIDTVFLSSKGLSVESYCAKINNPLNDSVFLLISKSSTGVYINFNGKRTPITLRVDSISFGNSVQLRKKSMYTLFLDSLINRGAFLDRRTPNIWGISTSNELTPFGTAHQLADWNYACDPHNFNLVSTNKSKIYSYRYDNNRGELLKIDSLIVNPPIKGLLPRNYLQHYQHYTNREIIKLKLSYDGTRIGFMVMDTSTNYMSYFVGKISNTGAINGVTKLDSFQIDLPNLEWTGKLGFEFSQENNHLMISVLRKIKNEPKFTQSGGSGFGTFRSQAIPFTDSIFSYNLNTGGKKLVLATDSFGISDLQIGSDGYIYGFGAESSYDTLSSINNMKRYYNIRFIEKKGNWYIQHHCFPKLKNKNYDIYKAYSFSSPSIHQPYNKLAGLKYEYCIGDTVNAYFTNDCIDSLKMHIIRNGIVLHTNTQDTLNYTLTQSGDYQLATVMHNQWGDFTDTNYFSVKQKDTFNLPTDTSMCKGDTLVLHVNQLANIQYWGDYSQDTNYRITDTGTYSIQALHACGLIMDTVQVSFDPVPKLTSNYIKDTTLCADTLHLRTQSNFAWNNGSKDSLWIIDTSGTYQVISNNQCGADTVELNFTLHDTLALSLGLDTVMCWGKLFYKYLPKDLADYTWFDNSTRDNYQFFAPGTYWVKAENTCGTWYDTLSIDTLYPASVNLGNDTATCSHLPLTLNAGAKDTKQTKLSWFWPHNGSRDSSLIINASGTYTVKVTDRCGTQTHSINVYQLSPPNLQLTDTSICKGDSIRLMANVDSAQIRWSTGDTVAAVWIKDFKTYGVGAVNRCGSDSTVFKVAELLPPKFGLPTDTILCNNSSWNVALNQPRSTYLWGNGQTDSKMQINQAGSYAVTISNACGMDNGMVQVKYLNTPLATVALSLNGKYCPGTPLTLAGSSINKDDTYFWNTGDSSQSIRVTEAGTYTLMVSNFCGSDNKAVTPNYYPIKAAFTLNQTEQVSPFELEATNQSEGAVNYQWLLDSNKVASTLNLRHRIIAYGKHSISLIASDAYGCADTAVDTVQVIRNPNIPPLLCDFRVDPNPARDYFVIAASNNDKQVRQVKIFNDIGQAIITTDVSHWKENPFYFEYKLNDLPSGTYLIGLYCDDETKYRRVVIAR